jgi:hypothetical protein
MQYWLPCRWDRAAEATQLPFHMCWAQSLAFVGLKNNHTYSFDLRKDGDRESLLIAIRIVLVRYSSCSWLSRGRDRGFYAPKTPNGVVYLSASFTSTVHHHASHALFQPCIRRLSTSGPFTVSAAKASAKGKGMHASSEKFGFQRPSGHRVEGVRECHWQCGHFQIPFNCRYTANP